MCARKQQNTEEHIHDFANRTLITCCKYLLQIRELIFVYSTDNLWLFNSVEPKIKFTLSEFVSLFHSVEERRRDSWECEGWEQFVFRESNTKIWLLGDNTHTHTLLYITEYRCMAGYTHTHTHTHSNYGLQLSYQSSQVCMIKVPPITGSLPMRMLTCLPFCKRHICKYVYSSSLSVSLFMCLLSVCLLFIWCVWGGRWADAHELIFTHSEYKVQEWKNKIQGFCLKRLKCENIYFRLLITSIFSI